MPLGIVKNDEFEKELINGTDKPRPFNPGVSYDGNRISIPSVQGEVRDIPAKGRGSNNVEVPNSLRQVIGETGQLDGRAEGVALAKSFGISPSSASAYANGSTSTSSYDKKPNKIHIERAKQRIAKKARRVLFDAMNNITEEKLADAKVGELSQVARNMSGIVKEMEPDVSNDVGDRSPQFIIFAPQIRKEEHFDVIQVKE